MAESKMTDAQAIKEALSMKRVLLSALKRRCSSSEVAITFWVLIELAVQSGIILYGKEEAIEKISKAVNYLIQREA